MRLERALDEEFTDTATSCGRSHANVGEPGGVDPYEADKFARALGHLDIAKFEPALPASLEPRPVGKALAVESEQWVEVAWHSSTDFDIAYAAGNQPAGLRTQPKHGSWSLTRAKAGALE